MIKESDGDWAADDLVLQHYADYQKHKVQQEHEGTQQLAHPPPAHSDGDNDEEKHEEEQNDGAEQAVAAHSHWSHVVQDCKE